ncbi:PREDICTED: transcription factor bHLH149-like [Camelina sativa]|uniref:Transcription factor bHLH149-like n=1 Tax=Camelina sativa TaxID=90675 RepID=A0ABM0WT26_CAMSA|nr:PREDICTED: transcription factor bHLH149-like [Camelina sativa]
MVDSNLFPSIETTGGESSTESRRKKPRISGTEATEIEARRINEESLKRWKTNRVQQIYASKLVEALRRVRQRSTNEPNKAVFVAAREIRETADRVIAASAKGTTRWSRAILASRVKAKLKKHKKAAKKKSTGNCKSRKASATETNRIKLPAVDRKLKFLGRLVPGCRKISVPNLLDEATDYIAALEMQVRAMEALAELLTAAAPRTTLTGP